MSIEAVRRRTNGVLVIQYNWEENTRNDENVWVYYKPFQEKSLHGSVDDASFKILSQSNRKITIFHAPKNLKSLFICPFKTLVGIHLKSIATLDVANGGLGVSASPDNNNVYIWETRDGTVRRSLEGHLFDVYRCKLFPSGVVVLSGGADMLIKIWDAATGTCPVTLQGHTAAVTDFSFIDKGKNIISVSKDGTARLWNCAVGKCLAVLVEAEAEINCCDLIHVGNDIDIPDAMETTDELEFETQGKVLAIGCEVGKIMVISVSARSIIAAHVLPSPVLCLCWLPNYYLVAGLEDGSVMVLNGKKLSEVPQLLCHDSASGVHCIKPFREGFFIGRRDGLCQFYLMDGSSPIQLTGSNCDPIYDIAADSKFIYTACRDAVIRKYYIEDLNLGL